MQKIYGASVRQDGLYKIGRNKWELIYGLGFDAEDETHGWNWRETFRGRKPSLEEIKTLVISTINAATDQKILADFRWNGKPVWLSQENQFNYKAAYDLAVQTAGATLPVTFKFGTDEEVQYHTFSTMEEFTDFYTKCMAHVLSALAAGWQEKDSVDWSKFEETC